MACLYCTSDGEDGVENLLKPQEKNLTPKELVNIIAQLHRHLGLTTVRFTGGEPLLYKQLPELIQGVYNIGIKNLSLTTNGILLEKQAPILKASGLTSINISLDAIDPLVFYKMSKRHDLSRTLRGIDTAVNHQLEVKINSVILKNINESQIIPLAQYAFGKNITIRFLEIMSMGHLFGKTDNYFFSQTEILHLINEHYSFSPAERTLSATANYWQTSEGNRFGIVANESQPFCSDCNRLRLDSFGRIYGCLSSNSPISVTQTSDKQLKAKLFDALAQKQSFKFKGSSINMLDIGG